jgi:hypothetical protein
VRYDRPAGVAATILPLLVLVAMLLTPPVIVGILVMRASRGRRTGPG